MFDSLMSIFGAGLMKVFSSKRMSASSNEIPGTQPIPLQSKEEPTLKEMIRIAAKTSIASSIGGKLSHQLESSLGVRKSRAALAGRSHRTFMNEAYPGTSPWERLGGNTQATGSVDNVSQQLKTQKEIAHIQANAKIKSAEIAARGIPSTIAQRVQQTLTEKERRKDIVASTKSKQLEHEKRRIDLKFQERMAKADLSYRQSRNILQQWRQATDGILTEQQAHILSASLQTIGYGAVAAYIAKNVGKNVPAVKMIRGLVKMIPKNMIKRFKSLLPKGWNKPFSERLNP